VSRNRASLEAGRRLAGDRDGAEDEGSGDDDELRADSAGEVEAEAGCATAAGAGAAGDTLTIFMELAAGGSVDYTLGVPAEEGEAGAAAEGGASYAFSPEPPSGSPPRLIMSPAEADGTVSLLQQRVWYAAQRSGLHLDNVKSGTGRKGAYLAERVGSIAAGLGLGSEAATAMLADAKMLPFAEGEIIQQVNSIPEAMGFITEGEVGMIATTPGGGRISLGQLGAGDYIGGTSLTRQRMITGVIALTDTTIVSVSRDAMNAIGAKDHRLARQIGDAIEMRRRAAREALADIAAQGLVP
jgi:hypothetical protein